MVVLTSIGAFAQTVGDAFVKNAVVFNPVRMGNETWIAQEAAAGDIMSWRTGRESGFP